MSVVHVITAPFTHWVITEGYYYGRAETEMELLTDSYEFIPDDRQDGNEGMGWGAGFYDRYHFV